MGPRREVLVVVVQNSPGDRGGAVAAGAVEAPRESGEQDDRPLILETVDAVDDGAAGDLDGEPAPGDHARSFLDLLCGNAADRRGPLRREGRGIVPISVKTDRAGFHKVPVIEILADEHVRYREGQRAVRAGIDLQVQIRRRGGGRDSGIDDDHLAASGLNGADLL